MPSSKTQQKLRNILFAPATIPWFFLLLCILAYAPLISRLGFYWDDLPYTWFYHTLGAEGYFSVFAGDRPFLAVIYYLTAPLMGTSPLAWQIFGIVCRWAATLVFWWSFKQVWPNHLRQVTLASAAFAVFPGFGQEYISSIFSRAFILQLAYVLSFGLMIAAIRKPQKYLGITLLSFLSLAFGLASSEYWYGLEIMRPFLIGFVVWEESGTPKDHFRRLLKLWAPYLIAALGYGIWRAFFFNSTLYSVQAVGELKSSPLSTIGSFLQNALQNVYTAGIGAWIEGFKTMDIREIHQPVTLLYWLLVIGSGILIALYFRNLKIHPATEGEDSAGQERKWGIQAVGCGLAGMFAATLPFWAAGLPYTLKFPWDRFGLTFMIPSSLFLIGLIETILRIKWQKGIVISLFLMLAVGEQYQIANTYRTEWVNLQKFLQQLTWRIPQLKPNTMLIAYELPFKYYSDNSLTAAVNWIYAPENHSYNLPYVLDYMSVRKNSYLSDLNPGVTVNQPYRSMMFTGSTSDSVVLYQQAGGCLHVMDTVYSNKKTIPQASLRVGPAIPLSNLGQIITHPDVPAAVPSDLNRRAPKEDWCAYFEKADLARQDGNWTKATQLGEQALKADLSAKDPSEWLPFIEAFAHTGKEDQALQISREQAKTYDSIINGLCQTWGRIGGDTSIGAAAKDAAAQIQVELKCQER